jgi:hypothetical protein
MMMSKRYHEPGDPRFADYAVAVSAIIFVNAAGIAAFGVDWSIGAADASTIWGCTDLTLLMSLRSAIRAIYARQFERLQARRDELASQLVDNPGEECFLYLRPFSSTGRVAITIGVERWHFRPPHKSKGKTYVDGEHVDLETELARALAGCGELVALGHPGEHVGAGRVRVEESEWQSTFARLAANAIAIFVVPGTSAGTQYELDQLWADPALRDKTFLILPPCEIQADGTPRGVFSKVRSDALKALAARRISVSGVRTEGGLLMRYGRTAAADGVPIMVYTVPMTYRGLLGLWLHWDDGHAAARIRREGVRNAIFRMEPRIAARWKAPRGIWSGWS